jgi:hypothetical protein
MYHETPQEGAVLLTFNVCTPLYRPPPKELPFGINQFGHKLDRPGEPIVILSNSAKPCNRAEKPPQTYTNRLSRRIPTTELSSSLLSPPVREAVEEARKKMSGLLTPITE